MAPILATFGMNLNLKVLWSDKNAGIGARVHDFTLVSGKQMRKPL